MGYDRILKSKRTLWSFEQLLVLLDQCWPNKILSKIFYLFKSSSLLSSVFRMLVGLELVSFLAPNPSRCSHCIWSSRLHDFLNKCCVTMCHFPLLASWEKVIVQSFISIYLKARIIWHAPKLTNKINLYFCKLLTKAISIAYYLFRNWIRRVCKQLLSWLILVYFNIF